MQVSDWCGSSPCLFKCMSHNMREEEDSKECGNVVLWSIWWRSVISLWENPPTSNEAPLEVFYQGRVWSKLFNLTLKSWNIGDAETSWKAISGGLIRGDKSPDKKQSSKTGEGGSLPDNSRDSLGWPETSLFHGTGLSLEQTDLLGLNPKSSVH